jgi:hypothetical protein
MKLLKLLEESRMKILLTLLRFVFSLVVKYMNKQELPWVHLSH